MTTEKVKILDACVKKDDIPKVYRSIAPIYDPKAKPEQPPHPEVA